jgi:RHS repeat-associated protein
VAANVNTATGSFWRRFIDLSIRGRGVPLSFGRTYDSAAASSDGPFGHGWTDDYNAFLTTDAAGIVTVHEENGATISFTPTASGFSAPTRVLAALMKNSDSTLTLTRKNQVQLLFSGAGQLLKEVDRDGYATSLTYSANRLTSVTDPAGRSLTIASDSNGHITNVHDSIGRSMSFGYDGNGNLTSAKDVRGGTTAFGYDANNRMVTMTDPRNLPFSIAYDGSGRVSQELDPMQRLTQFAYSPGVTTMTLPDGSVRVDQYTTNELTSMTDAYGTSVAATWKFVYDPATLGVTSATNPDQHTTQATFDATGNVLARTDALNRTTHYGYDALNDLTTISDPTGQQVLLNAYDARGNLMQTTKGQVAVTSYTYDPNQAEDIVATSDPAGKIWQYTYDAFGNRLSATDPMGGVTTATYDAVGRVVSSTSPKGNQSGVNPSLFTSHYSYDPFGDLLQATDPLGNVTKFQYDANRNQVQATDADGHSTAYTYDGDNEQVDVARADGTHLKSAYDAMGRTVKQTDPLSHSVNYGYDLRGQLASQTDVFNHTTHYQYSLGGDLLAAVDPNQRTTSYTYDAADQLTNIAYSPSQTPNVSFTYDADGRRLTMQDGSGTSHYSYDTLSRLIASTDGTGQSVAYGYDLTGNLLTLTYPGGSQVTRSYDADGHLASVSDWLRNASVFSYDADGNLIKAAYPNTVTTIYAYDPAGRLQVVDASNGGTGRFRRVTYGHDPAGLVKSQSDTISQMVNGVIRQTTISTTNGYDMLNRLVSIAFGSTPGKLAYDVADNLTSRSIGGTSVTSTYDAGHELLTQATTNGASLAFTYDAYGNRIQKAISGGPTLGYSYDQANRLTQLSTTTFAYNGDGLRVTKQDGAGAVQHFTWELGDGTPILIKDATGSYVTGPGGRPIEQIMPDNTVFYLIADELGSTETITNSGGQPVTQYAYPDPYGAVTLSQSGTPQTPFLYAGQYTDSDTGLQYLGSRYYDGTTGNFLTPDAAAGLTRQPYSYAGDSPFNAAGLSSQLPSLSGTPEPTPDLLHRVAATSVQGVGNFLGETHDDLVSGDPLHVTLGVVNSFQIALTFMGAAEDALTLGRAILPTLADESSALPRVLYHYSTRPPEDVFRTGLRSDKYDRVFLTTAGDLSPVKAQIELALPGGRGYPTSLWAVRTADLQALGLKLTGPRQVTWLEGGGAGGGWEVVASGGPVPARLLTRVW